jgi:hypothetical protein
VVQGGVNAEAVQFVWYRERLTERTCTVCVVQEEVNEEAVQYVWYRYRLMERMHSMCGAGRG